MTTLDHKIQIIAGLLASGHFTVESHEDNDDDVKLTDYGKEWDENGYPCRFMPSVIDAAEYILMGLTRVEAFQNKGKEAK